jgi:hypothetical protein
LPFNWIVPTNSTYYSISSPKLGIETKNFEMNYWNILSFEFKLWTILSENTIER